MEPDTLARRSLALRWRQFARDLAGALAVFRPRRLRHDREVLERVILPSLASREDMRKILFVGCASYTQHYAALFARAEFWTLDRASRKRRYGTERHIVAPLEQLDRHFGAGELDAIVCNGVLGWGLNEPDQCEAAFAACHRVLRSGGELVVGWNDVRPRNRVRPEDIAALQAFAPFAFPGLSGSRERTRTRNAHTFDFYRKR